MDGNRHYQKVGVGLLVVTIYRSFARLIAPVVTTISLSLAPIIPANSGSPGKWSLKLRETMDIGPVQSAESLYTFHVDTTHAV